MILASATAPRGSAPALAAGARGYVLKSQASADLFEAVRQVMRGEVYLPPSLALDARSWRVTPSDRGPRSRSAR